MRDSGSKPLEVYAYFGIEAGMTVVDLIPGNGYNTHLLSALVGPEGKVVAGPDYRRALADRSWPLENVEIFDDAAGIPVGTAEVIVTVRNMHDIENGIFQGHVAWEEDYSRLLRALKPGGILGVVEARTHKEGFDAETHRINEKVIIRHALAVGFELVGSSDLLANPDDDFGRYEGRGRRVDIDRMVLKFRRPE